MKTAVLRRDPQTINFLHKINDVPTKAFHAHLKCLEESFHTRRPHSIKINSTQLIIP